MANINDCLLIFGYVPGLSSFSVESNGCCLSKSSSNIVSSPPIDAISACKDARCNCGSSCLFKGAESGNSQGRIQKQVA